MRWDRLCLVADDFNERHKAWQPLLNALNDDTVAGLELGGAMLHGHAWAYMHLVCAHACMHVGARARALVHVCIYAFVICNDMRLCA